MKKSAVSTSHLIRATLATCLVLASGSPAAWATARSWNTNVSGSAAIAGNWSPAAMPTSADDLTFNRTVDLTITFDNNVTVVNSHTYRGTHQITLNPTSPHNASAFFRLGSVSGDDPIVVMNSGDLSCGGNITVAEVSGAGGHLTLSGVSTTVRTTGTTDDVIIGGAGTGILMMTAAAEVESKDDIILGSSATGDGTANVSGGTGAFPNASVSTLHATGGASNIIVGNSGTGTLNLSAGGLADAADDVQIAPLSGSTGTVTIGGSYSIFSARLHAANNIDIARNDVATTAGTGTVTVNAIGILAADNQLRIGDPNGGTGTLNIHGGNVFCGSLVCDQTGHAVLDFDDGTLTVDGGTVTPPAAAFTLEGGVVGDDPTLKLNNGATFTLGGQLRVGNSREASLEVNSGSLLDLHLAASSPIFGANSGSNGSLLVNGTNSSVNATNKSLNIGLSGTATMNIQNGGAVTTGDTVIGNQANSDGTVTVTGANSLLDVGSTLRLASAGTGVMNVQSGAHVDSTAAFLAAVAGSSATATVVNGGTQWNTGTLYVGGSNVASGGTAQVNVTASGTLNVTGGACKLWPNGTLSIPFTGTVNCTPEMEVQGTLAMSGGVFNGDTHLVNGDITGSGHVNGELNVTSGVSTITATGGTLDIGDDAVANAISNFGTFIAPTGGTVFLHSLGQAFCGDITLSGGVINASHGMTNLANDVLTGTGTVAGEFFNVGNITPTGAAGITFSNLLHNTTSNKIVGTKINFSGTGGYVGSGTCNADIIGASTSSITPTGTLSIGANTNSGFSYSGHLNVGGFIVTLLDANGAVFGAGALTELNSGRLECPAGIGNSNGATIKGDGLFVGSVTNAGTLDPHSTNPATGGLMTVQGNFGNNLSGIVDIEIADTPGSGNYDRINVSGTASFDGTIRVSLKNGFIPRVGQQFIAVNAVQGRSGTFATLISPSGGNAPCNNVTFVMVYSSTAAIVLVRPPLGCTALGDLNSDGGCNAADIAEFIGSMLNGPYNNCSDMNGDCKNDGDDIQIFANCLL